MKYISIIGSGYVGLVTGICLAEKGFSVICVDIDEEKVNAINNGITPIFEPNLEPLLKKNIESKRFQATTDLKNAISASEISMITVGTPYENGQPNLKDIMKVATEIGEALKNKDQYHVVVVKSTVPPETTDTIIVPLIEQYSGKKVGADFGIGMNPEFLREGCAVSDFINPDRIVIGGFDQRSIENIKELYSKFDCNDFLVTNIKTAEMIKYASNCILATLISFSNEIANVCATMKEVDVTTVLEGIHLDKRFNPFDSNKARVNPEFLSYIKAGCGFGGSCFPKDIRSFIGFAKIKGVNPRLLEAVIKINENQPHQVIDILNKKIPSYKNHVLTVLGLSFKAGTDDMRESPAIPIINYLLEQGAKVRIYDPAAMTNASKLFNSPNVVFAPNLENSLIDTEAVIILVGWDEFRSLPDIIKNMRGSPIVVDARRIFKRVQFLNYYGIGVS